MKRSRGWCETHKGWTDDVVFAVWHALRAFPSIYIRRFQADFLADFPNVHPNLWWEPINNKSAQQIPSNEAYFGFFVWPIYSNARICVS